MKRRASLLSGSNGTSLMQKRSPGFTSIGTSGMNGPAVAGVDEITSRSRVANGRMNRSAPIRSVATPAAIAHLRIEPGEGQAEGAELKQDAQAEDHGGRGELVAPAHRGHDERDRQPEDARERQQVAPDDE